MAVDAIVTSTTGFVVVRGTLVEYAVVIEVEVEFAAAANTTVVVQAAAVANTMEFFVEIGAMEGRNTDQSGATNKKEFAVA